MTSLHVVVTQFSQNKLIVFVSSCEAVEFLHSLFTSVLSRPRTSPELSFLRLHGSMKQEVSSPCGSASARGLSWLLDRTCLFLPPGALRGLPAVLRVSVWSPALYSECYCCSTHTSCDLLVHTSCDQDLTCFRMLQPEVWTFLRSTGSCR